MEDQRDLDQCDLQGLEADLSKDLQEIIALQKSRSGPKSKKGESPSMDLVDVYTVILLGPQVRAGPLAPIQKKPHQSMVAIWFVTSLGLFSKCEVQPGYFTHILIDEAAQAREAEIAAVLSLANEHTKVIIAGDHLQVWTCVKC